MERNEMTNTKKYDFDIIVIIKAGWEHINGIKTHLALAFLIYMVVAIGVQIALGLVFPQGTAQHPHLLNQFIVSVISMPILVPLLAGIMMMAIKHTRAEEINFKDIFNYYRFTGVLSLAAILVYSFTMLGLLVFVLPGLYLSIAYTFVMPLIIDKQMGIWEAMEHSRKMVTQHWFKIFGLIVALALIAMVSAIPLGIGLFWTMPLMFVTLYGLLYPVLFE